MTSRRRARVLVLFLLDLCLVGLCAMGLTGCVSVPTSGPAQKVDGPAAPCQNCVDVEVQPPTYGDEPKQIVEGYLRATSNYQPNYAVAKQYLTKSAVERWSPEDGAQIFSGSPVTIGRDKVVLDGQLQGSLGPDRTYTAQHRALKWDFGLVKENGNWRISRPPAGLMVADNSFARFYQSYDIYFVGNGSVLVPDPIYLPRLPNEANVAAVLMKALLGGPSTWLRPAVTSALPADTALSVDSVTLQDGVAQVPLSDAVIALNDRQRSLLTAQVIYTLRQAAGIEKVLFKVNQQPFGMPQSDPDTLEVPVARISPDVDPVPFVAGDQLYAVRNKSVQLTDMNSTSPQARAMPGPLGQGRYDVDSLAINAANTDIAVVSDHRRVLRAGTTATGTVATKLTGVTNLLRPQYSRYGELWAVGESGGRQRIWTIVADHPVEVATPLLAGATITAFKISPDGTRMALIRRVGQQTQLGLARITRADKITLDGWRPLDTTQTNAPEIALLRDVAWLDATDLLVLGATSRESGTLPYQVTQDASLITPLSEPNNTDPVEVTVLLGTQGAQTSVLIGRKGQSFRDDGEQWSPLLTGCSTLAFPS